MGAARPRVDYHFGGSTEPAHITVKRNRAARRNHYLIVRLLILCLNCSAEYGCTSPFENSMRAALETPSISTPARVGETRIKNEWNELIRLRVAERTSDGGFIIAGSAPDPMGPKGWVVKTDEKGRLLWSYYTGLRDLASVEPGQPISYAIHGAPTYYGAFPMPDGSTFLCGQMPNVPAPGSDKPWGILTHLDKTGALISERLLSPHVEDAEGTKGLETLQQCIRWGDGVAIVGSAVRYLPRAPGIVSDNSVTFYWVIALNRAGEIRWEKLIPETHVKWGALADGNLVLQSYGSNLVFSATDNSDSEVIDLGPQGEVVARKPLHGQFRLIRSVVPETAIQIWGTGRGKQKSEVVTLNDRMEEVGHKEGAPDGDCFPRIIYRMPDQSYVLFASIMHPPSHVLHTAIAHVDGDLRAVRVFEPLSGPGPFVDFGRLDAAAPAGDPGVFVVAMGVIARGLDSNNRSKLGILPDFIRGVDLNFIKVNQQ
jgi:hypothetical protein